MLLPTILAATLAQAVPAPQPDSLTKPELAVFNDAAFERQFAASYAAETDIEPRLTEPERKLMLEALKAIQADRLPDALALLEKSRTDASSATIDFTIANIHFQSERFPQAAVIVAAQAVDRSYLFPKLKDGPAA